MTLDYLQKIRKELPDLLSTTTLHYFKNDIAFTLDQKVKLYFKRQVAFHLYSITQEVLASQDIWTIITDILFTNHSITLYSIITQIYNEYTPSMLPYLTTPQLDKSIFYDISRSMDINIILYKPQLCPDYVVRLEQFNIDIIPSSNSNTTWIIYTEPIDCLFTVDQLNELCDILEDPAIDIDPTEIRHDFLLTLEDNKDIDKYSDHFMRIAFNFYYNARRYRAEFEGYQGTRWNALFHVWGGTTLEVEPMTLKLFIAQCVKISTSINGLVSIIYKDSVCHITRFPNKHYIICHVKENGGLCMPIYTYQELEKFKAKSVCEFVEEYGDVTLL